jgi:Glycosyl hydrolases family 25
MTRAQFVDMSEHNPTGIDWNAYKTWSASGDGISRVCLRSSYGNGYADKNYPMYLQGAHTAGINIVIHYHYAYPQYNSPQNEADWQKNVIGQIGPQDIIMLDFEEDNDSATASWAYSWLARQQTNYPNNQVVLYSYPALIAKHLQTQLLALFPLFLAAWQYDPNEIPQAPSPWSAYLFVQYSDKQVRIPGIPGPVDADVYVAPPRSGPTTAQLQAASDEWNALFQCPQGTGIYQSWLTRYVAGKFAGPPITQELYGRHDWNGKAITVQYFAWARCEWDSTKNSARWFAAPVQE